MHGGANEAGSAGGGLFAPDGMYDNGHDDVVVVTTQYRLGVFGFLGSPELQRHTADGSAGNFGLQDQRMGLEWVQEHIRVFVRVGASFSVGASFMRMFSHPEHSCSE